MVKRGMNIEEFCSYFSKLDDEEIGKMPLNIGKLKNEKREVFKDQFDKVDKINSLKKLNGINKSDDNYIKGMELEKLVRMLFSMTGDYYTCCPNIRTSTNEIDLVSFANEKGNLISIIYGREYKTVLCECKNYSKPVGVTYVGKFSNLTYNSNINIGIMFSWKGMAGRGWNSSKGIVKKTFYLKENMKDKVYILDFNKDDFQKIIKGESFFEILKMKCGEIAMDIDFTRYFIKHPEEEGINTLITNNL